MSVKFNSVSHPVAEKLDAVIVGLDFCGVQSLEQMLDGFTSGSFE